MRINRARDSRHAEIGQRLRSARLRLGISQVEVGKRLGVSYQQVNKYERGSNVLSGVAVLDLAELLHVRVGWLLGEPGSEESGPPVASRQLESRLLTALAKLEGRGRRMLALRTIEALAASAMPVEGDEPLTGDSPH
jgi:transcriptional regulator with XRE-family HTH domain